MSWDELRDLDEWRSRLGLEGRVAVGPRRWLDVLLGLYLTPVGGAMVLGSLLADAALVVRVAVGLCGAISVLAAGGVLVRGLRPGPVLVVEREGLTLPRLRLSAPWSAVLRVDVVRAPRHSWLEIHLVPDAIEQWRRDTGAGWLARRQVSDGFVRVSGSLVADKDLLAAWISQEARVRRT